MTQIPDGHEQICTRCGSKLIKAEWDEPVSAREVQYLWHCLNCSNEFVTQAVTDEIPTPEAEVMKPFFTSLVVE